MQIEFAICHINDKISRLSDCDTCNLSLERDLLFSWSLAEISLLRNFGFIFENEADRLESELERAYLSED